MKHHALRLFLFLCLVGPVSSLYTACNNSGNSGGSTPACSALGDQSSADFSGTTSVASLGVTAGTTKAVAGGSVITVTGDDVIDGTLEVLPGGATIIFQGALTWNGELKGSNADTSCGLAALKADASSGEDKEPDDIILELQKDATFSNTFKLNTDTSVKVTDDHTKLPTNDEADTQTTSDDGTGNVLAPFATSGGGSPLVVNTALATSDVASLVIGNTWIFGGTFKFATPPKGTKRIVVAIQPFGTTNVDLGGLFPLTITGPDGRDGESKTTTGNCTGNKGGDAMTFYANIEGDLTVSDFTLNSGSGGKGGDCICNGNPDCTSTAGDGGKNGNVKMRTTGSFDVAGSMTINPGNGGGGGDATANALDGVDGCPPTPGGNATATGGKGADKKKVLTTRNVGGIGNIAIGAMTAGSGGKATANGGVGGDNTCACPPPGDGADGGNATATGGKGGDASLTSSGAATSAVTGGNGGDADSNNGIGGNGNSCDKNPAGNGGMGGDMTATDGDGGTGTTANGTDGNTSLGADAGKGGNGGDGLPPGSKGIGGTCNNDGASSHCPDGLDGNERLDLLVLLCWSPFTTFDPLFGSPPGGTCGPISSGPASGPHTVSLEDQAMTTTLGTVQIQLQDLSGTNNGQVCVSRTDASPTHIGLQNGAIDIEMVSLNLTSSTPITVGLRESALSFGSGECDELRLTPSAGTTIGQPVDIPVTFDGNVFQTDSFFDVFKDVQASDLTSVRVEGRSTATDDSNCFWFVDVLYILDP